MAYKIDNIEKAIHEFYFGGTKYGEAHQWLTAAQVSVEAWSFCWELMLPTKPPEIQFFGASTLQVKIAKHWAELPADQFAPLKQKLLDYIVNYSSGPKIVLTRLCIAISSYIIHTISEYWTTAISDIIRSISPQHIPNLSTENIYGILIEILTVLPEEFQSVLLPHLSRGAVRLALANGIPQVLPVLEQVLSSSGCSSELRLQAIKCFASWIQFGIPLSDCESVLTLLLDAAQDDSLSDGALDCLSTLMCHQDVHKYAVSLQRLIGKSLQLESLVARGLAERDTDSCYGVYFLFTSVAESHLRMLLENILEEGEHRNNTLRLVQLILQCTSTPGQFPVDETCSGLVFNFWFMLQDDIASSEPAKRSVYMSYFVPVYSNLVDILIQKSIFPDAEVYSTWSTDDKEQFRCYRQDIGDTLMNCFNILREPMLQKLNSHMETVLMKLSSNDSTVWLLLEACLFAFESIAESIDLEEQLFLPQLFACLPNIPFNNFRVIDTALTTIGAYAEWIHYHPDILGHIIPLLVTGLRNKDMAPAATRALKEISRDCQDSMKPFAHQILTESQQSMANNVIHPNECVRLMYTIGRVLSVIDVDEILSYLTNLLTPYLQELENYTRLKPSPQLQSRLLTLLNMLSMLFGNLDTKLKTGDSDDDSPVSNRTTVTVTNAPDSLSFSAEPNTSGSSLSVTPAVVQQPVLIVMQEILPIIHKVGVTWAKHSEVTEAICDLLKKCVTTLLNDCLSLMPDILNLMVILYRIYPTSGILDLSKQFLLIFANDVEHLPLLRQMFANIVQVTMALCDMGIAEHTDIVQGFLQVLAQIIKKVPNFLVHEDFNLSPLFQCGIVGLSLQEALTVKAASAFLTTFITRSIEIPVMHQAVNEHGDALVEQILRCIGGDAPRGVIDHMSDILLALNKNYFNNLCHWMTPTIQSPNFPSARLTTEQKEHYIRLILRERVNKRKLQETVKEFTLVCRGLMGTEYATQIMPFFG